ncbi:nitrate/nitrite transporter NrtS [Candidatus Rariloculus sp.]|uniref:nitrate/nitrite transporter NrtS n=1 Tax=Candidatus Rariloculus sp. TaxID=3101265 RepID=UPI003D0D4F22
MSSWLSIVTQPRVWRRALLYGLVVGAILIAINHGDALLRGDIDGVRILKMILTPLVPFVVSTQSSVGAIRNFERRNGP